MKNKIKVSTKTWIKDKTRTPIDYKYRNITKYKEGNTVLIGMRRIGKSEYLKFRYNTIFPQPKLATAYVDESNIVVDDMNYDQNNESDILNVILIDFDDPIYSSIDFSKKESNNFAKLSQAIEELIEENEIKLILLDEIQRRVEWTIWLKGFADKYPEITFVAAGSDLVNMISSSEFGGGRFKTLFMGLLTFAEFCKMKGPLKSNLNDYMDNHVFPSDIISLDLEQQFTNTIEKQLLASNITSRNIKSVLQLLALNPGREINNSMIKRTLMETSDAKPDEKQIKAILSFLVNSKLLIKLDNKYAKDRTSNKVKSKYYPANWNSFKFYTEHKTINELNNDTKPKYSFVFENMIISNVISSANTNLELETICYYEPKKNGVDCNLVVNDLFIEIKSFDVFEVEKKTLLEEIVIKIQTPNHFANKMVIHAGKTRTYQNILFMNAVEFLKKEKWKTNQK